MRHHARRLRGYERRQSASLVGVPFAVCALTLTGPRRNRSSQELRPPSGTRSKSSRCERPSGVMALHRIRSASRRPSFKKASLRGSSVSNFQGLSRSR